MADLQPTFQQAMEITASWLRQWENEEISDEVLADRIGEMVASRDGARGFFVVSLAGDSALMDRLPDPVVGQLRAAGEGVVDLSVRNLAMSSAMALQHQRTGDEAQQAGSEQVRARCTELLRLLEPDLVKQRLEQLLEGCDNRGDDVSFLKRWGYDDGQIRAISASALAVAHD
ncbi:hypothetical protein KR100_11645 [Synechococcus sp. KORDI-100]|uniref:hypothetical protein n=1 Tax=Synechococcus sp. KORDI-100 TaxID=1280380 RepID=UPI0004E07351|nr:hypothetical protein [Synechococcus sp. KORDI-100]AII44008.1 hypothetical protein KR100_11645 [Synechococcus sp. KORDI-100]